MDEEDINVPFRFIWINVKKEEYNENFKNLTNHTKLNNLDTCISQSQVK